MGILNRVRNQTAGFTALRVIKTCTQHLLVPPDKVFPLLCPTLEYDWIEPGKCRMVRSESGFAELDCIFVTEFPNEGKEMWIVSVYRPNEEIQFVRSHCRQVIPTRITLNDNGNGTTTAEWTHLFTGLNEDGNRCVASVTDEGYRQRILERGAATQPLSDDG